MTLSNFLGGLSPESWVVLLSLVLSTALIYRQVHIWYRLRHIPGPKLAAWSILWQLRGALSGQYHEVLRDVADKYGPLVRIGPNQLLSTDPEELRRFGAPRSGYTKGNFYKSGRIAPGVDNVVSMRDEKKHREMKDRMSAGYAGKENEGANFESGIDRQILEFIDLLDRKYVSTASETRSFDLSEKTQFFALDVIGDISLGKAFGYLAKDEDLFNYNQINESSLPVMNVVSVLPWLTHIIHRWPLSLILPKEGDQVGFGRLMSIASHLVDQRLNGQAPHLQDMLQAHINNGMCREELIQNVLIFLIAGSNSTAHALRMTLVLLMTNPQAYNALIAEIRGASTGVSHPITWTETQTLPYLRAVIREGLRVWTPIGGLGFKRVPAGGENVSGYFVPGGTEIGQGFHGVGRSKAVWGPDADVFRPERWLVAEDEELSRMIATVDTNFGAGKYACLGKPIALMELHKAVFELLRQYDFSLLYPEKQLSIKSSVFLSASNIWVRITKRVP